MKASHILIDMEARCGRPETAHSFAPEEWATLKANQQPLMRGLAQAGVDTIYGTHAPDYRFPFFGTWGELRQRHPKFENTGCMIDSDFALQADSLLALRSTGSVGRAPGLLAHLHAKEIDTIILSGWSEGADQENSDIGSEAYCLATTAIHLRQHGFHVIIAAEATDAAIAGEEIDFWYQSTGNKRVIASLDVRQERFGKTGVLIRPTSEILELVEPQRSLACIHAAVLRDATFS